MTDDGAGNPRFAFIPKRAWDLILDLAPIPLAGVALWYSGRFIGLLVRLHSSSSSGMPTGRFQPIHFAFDRFDSLAMTIAIGVSLYFLLRRLLRRREKAGALDREGFGRSRLLVASATIVVVMLAAFWFLDVRFSNRQPLIGESCAEASAALGGAWAMAAVTAFGLRRLGKRFEAICLLPPIASLVAPLLSGTITVTAEVAVKLVEEMGKDMLYPTTTGLVVLLTICFTTCVLPVALWAEWRLFYSSRRSIGIACAALWAVATVMALELLWMKIPYY